MQALRLTYSVSASIMVSLMSRMPQLKWPVLLGILAAVLLSLERETRTTAPRAALSPTLVGFQSAPVQRDTKASRRVALNTPAKAANREGSPAATSPQRSQVGSRATQKTELAGRSIVGYVLDQQQQPVKGARVLAWRGLGGSQVLDRRATNTTDERGAFELVGEPCGATSVRVEHEEFFTWEGRLGAESSETIELQGRNRLHGQVLTHEGLPAGGLRLSLPFSKVLSSRVSTFTDEAGNFSLKPEVLETSILEVYARHDLLLAVQVDPSKTQELQLVLPQEHSLGVNVLDPHGEPLRDARVVLMRASDGHVLASRQSDAQGQLLFERAPTEPLQLLAEHPTALFDHHEVRLGCEEVVLQAKPAARLRLRCTKPTEFTIELVPGSGVEDVTRHLWKSPTQDLTCGALAPGEWQVLVRRAPSKLGSVTPSALLKTLPIFLQPEVETTLELEPGERGSLLVHAAPSPSSAVHVRLERECDGALFDRGALDAAGCFDFPHVPVGRYSLVFEASGGGTWRAPHLLLIEADTQTRAEISLPTHGVVLHIRDPRGRPLPQAEARLTKTSTGVPRGGAITQFMDASGVHRYDSRVAAARANGDGTIWLLWASPTTVGDSAPSLWVAAPGFQPERSRLHSKVQDLALQPEDHDDTAPIPLTR